MSEDVVDDRLPDVRAVNLTDLLLNEQESALGLVVKRLLADTRRPLSSFNSSI
jgi:FXSXX-COOH protein